MSGEMFRFVQYMISMLFMMAFLLIFLPPRYKMWKSLIICGIAYILLGITNVWLIFGNSTSGENIGATITQIVIVQGLAYILCMYRDARALFVGTTSSTFVLIGDITATMIQLYFNNIILALVIQVLIHCGILFVLVLFFSKHWEEEMRVCGKKWEAMCVLPILIYIVVYFLIRWPGKLSEQPGNGAAVIVLMILMIYCYILVIQLSYKSREETELIRSIQFLETYSEGIRREAETVSKKEAEMMVFRHDTRHTYNIIRNYLESGDEERAKELLTHLVGQIDILKPHTFCENVAINGIISTFNQKAKKQDIDFICKTNIPEELGQINEYELATVISNLLENAVNAAEVVPKNEERYIKVTAFPFKEQLMIEIKNSFTGELDISKETGLPNSHGGITHGYGLRSVTTFATKNGAAFEYTHEKSEFCAQLLIQI